MIETHSARHMETELRWSLKYTS